MSMKSTKVTGLASDDMPVAGSSIEMMFEHEHVDATFLFSKECDTLRALSEALHCELRRLNKGPFMLRFEP
jgi:hypothetical protein